MFRSFVDFVDSVTKRIRSNSIRNYNVVAGYFFSLPLSLIDFWPFGFGFYPTPQKKETVNIHNSQPWKKSNARTYLMIFIFAVAKIDWAFNTNAKSPGSPIFFRHQLTKRSKCNDMYLCTENHFCSLLNYYSLRLQLVIRWTADTEEKKKKKQTKHKSKQKQWIILILCKKSDKWNVAPYIKLKNYQWFWRNNKVSESVVCTFVSFEL